MRDDLRVKGVIPSSDPYNLGITSSCDPNTIANVVDWVLIQLRDKSDSTVVLAETAALLKTDGNIISATNCSDTQVVFNLSPDNYFVSVNHRNHLGAMSLSAESISSAPQTLDYTNSSNPGGITIYGTNAQVALTGTVNGLWAGDVNADGRVANNASGSDANSVANQVLAAPGNVGFFGSGPLNTYTGINNAYDPNDVNMDGNVLDNAIPSDSDRIRNIVLSHPANTGFFSSGPLNTYIIIEQLP